MNLSLPTDASLKIPGWILFIYLVYSQAIPAFDYDWGIRMGTQDSPEAVTPIGASFWYGFCLSDLVWYIPMLGIGMVFYERNQWGKNALVAALGITVYWPIVCITAAIRAGSDPNWEVDTSGYWIPLFIVVAWALWSIGKLSFPCALTSSDSAYESIPNRT